MTSGNPLDKATNVWHTIADDLTALNLFLTQLTTFYTAIDASMSAAIATSGHRIRCYDLADIEPRAPVVDQPLTGFTPSTTVLPPELAIALSYQAPRQSGQSQARRRGRIYLGPWSDAASNSSTGGIAAATATAIGNATQNMLDASQAATTWAWAVYSPTNQLAIEVNDAWQDNAWDVQRRRGVAPTARTTYT